MARRQHTGTYLTEDGSVAITVQAMGGVEAGLLGIRLGSIIGPALAGIVSAMENEDPESITKSMSQLFTKLSASEFKDILKLVLAGAQASTGNEFLDVNIPWLDDAFASCPGSLYKLMFDGIKVNFASFSKELGLNADLMSKLKKVAVKAASKAVAS